MTRHEWEEVHDYLRNGCSKGLTTNAKTVYYENLYDIGFELMMYAARQVLRNQTFCVFPQIGSLRQAALDIDHRLKSRHALIEARHGVCRVDELCDRIASIGRMPAAKQLPAPRPVSRPVPPLQGANASEDQPPF